ncbi:hypothetical protein B0H13DRAFT_1900461 [Mycena leptocephala]|nr:hypothetical protein B0H13DRAFT_1900461 [Mycena leptocephala]
MCRLLPAHIWTLLLGLFLPCYGWGAHYNVTPDEVSGDIIPCQPLTFWIVGDGPEPFVLDLIPHANSSDHYHASLYDFTVPLPVWQYTFTNKSTPLVVRIPYTIFGLFPVIRDGAGTGRVFGTLEIAQNLISRGFRDYFPISGEVNTTEGLLGFDWIPSIEPNRGLVVIASDNRGFGAGGIRSSITQPGEKVCGFNISDQYSVMQRWLFYLLLVSGLVLHHSSADWLTGAVLGAAMVISMTIAFHAFVLRYVKKPGFTDLDSLVIIQILALCVYISMPFIFLSFKGRSQKPIYFIFVMIWAFVCYAGVLCAIGAATANPQAPCVPYNTTAGLTVPVNATLCAESCLQQMSPIRVPGSAVPIPFTSFDPMKDTILAAKIAGGVGGGLTLLLGLFRIRLSPPSEEEMAEEFDGIFMFASLTRVGLFCIGGGIAGFIVQLIAGERALHDTGIDYPGPFKSPSQWMPWVAVVLTTIATCLVYALKDTGLGGATANTEARDGSTNP